MPTKEPAKSAYAQAGVNIDVKMNAVGSIKQMVASTKTANVIGNIGAFGGHQQTENRGFHQRIDD